MGIIIGVLVLILILIFVVQNSTSVHFSYLGAHFSLPAGVAMLLAVIVGVILMAIVGTARIHQLRRALKHRRPR
ncbi:DUF1049 domain-containing protein [Rhodococcus sp. D2-41]|nr:DUF1049 domain-containing protein [Rhodococcus sp. D2-41]